MNGPLHFCMTEHEKLEALKQNAENFDACMCLTLHAKCELQWWIDPIDTAVNQIYWSEPHITLHTDAYKQG